MQKTNLNKDNIKILVCCHKPCVLPSNPYNIFFPMHVGASVSKIDLGFQRDDRLNNIPCDSISDKNPNYCELTAMYWAWKNIKKLYPDLEYIGLNHYRRYFSFDKQNHFDDSINCMESEIKHYELDLKTLRNVFKHYDVIVAKQKKFSYSLFIEYAVSHYSEDLRSLKTVIDNLYPEYSDSFSYIMTRNNLASLYNMMIMRYSDFDKYCKWLFDVLFELEKIINIEHYTPVQARIWGYMAERLFNVWLYHNKKKTKKMNVVFYSDISSKNSFLMFFSCIRRSVAFLFNRPLKNKPIF